MENITKKKKLIINLIIIIALIVLLLPIPLHYKDGGTVEYKALAYSVTDYHAIHSTEGEYLVGKSIEIFGIEIFYNTRVEKIY
jgi:hypothetical protein